MNRTVIVQYTVTPVLPDTPIYMLFFGLSGTARAQARRALVDVSAFEGRFAEGCKERAPERVHSPRHAICKDGWTGRTMSAGAPHMDVSLTTIREGDCQLQSRH